MLTVDLVQAWRKGNRLFVRHLNRATKERAQAIATAYIEIAHNHIGASREEFDTKCAAIEGQVQDRKLAAGLLKLVLDRCVFEMSDTVDPVALREAVFKEASLKRRKAEDATGFNRDDVLSEASAGLSISKGETEEFLFADLKEAYRLVSFDGISSDHLVALYEKSQGQAVLLKAVRVEIIVETDTAVSLRRLFHKLKFLGLMHVISRLPNGGYLIEVDGPFCMFKQVTKYGLKLAMLVPALDECGAWKLNADVIWGKEKQRLTFHMEGTCPQILTQEEPRLADDVAILIKRFQDLKTDWKPSPSNDVLELPGIGLCIPDLTFVHSETGEVAYLEVMGFWSRDAVWKRVELVEAGLPYRIIFAVSKRLRVSEEVLGDELPGSLYVYKGVMNAARIAEMLNPKA